MTENLNIPTGFERVEHHDALTLFNEDEGIIIDVHERDSIDRLLGKYPYRVIGSQNQKAFYDGSFQSISHAEEKVIELAHNC